MLILLKSIVHDDIEDSELSLSVDKYKKDVSDLLPIYDILGSYFQPGLKQGGKACRYTDWRGRRYKDVSNFQFLSVRFKEMRQMERREGRRERRDHEIFSLEGRRSKLNHTIIPDHHDDLLTVLSEPSCIACLVER
jgi:hypothetical protein